MGEYCCCSNAAGQGGGDRLIWTGGKQTRASVRMHVWDGRWQTQVPCAPGERGSHNDLAARRAAITNGQCDAHPARFKALGEPMRLDRRRLACGPDESGGLRWRRWILATGWSVLQFKLHNSFFCFLNEHKTRYNVRILLFLFFKTQLHYITH